MQIKKRMDAVMQPDQYGKNGSYMVRTQYYDSIFDSDLQDNLNGVWKKGKIRIRIYSPDAVAAKLEYKYKEGAEGKKYSVLLTREEALQMENKQYSFLLEKESLGARRLYMKMTELWYAPKTIVEYDRTAYTYPVSDVRVTFDRNLRGTINPYGLFEPELAFAPLLTADKGILEVKYNDFFPAALKWVFAGFEELAESYSKYSNARLSYI